jgi:hypothetical protein
LLPAADVAGTVLTLRYSEDVMLGSATPALECVCAGSKATSHMLAHSRHASRVTVWPVARCIVTARVLHGLPVSQPSSADQLGAACRSSSPELLQRAAEKLTPSKGATGAHCPAPGHCRVQATRPGLAPRCTTWWDLVGPLPFVSPASELAGMHWGSYQVTFIAHGRGADCSHLPSFKADV